MKRGQDQSALHLEPLAANTGYACSVADQGLGGYGAEADDYSWADKPDLLKKIGTARGDLLPSRRSVSRRPAFYHAGYVYFLARKAQAGQKAVEELSRRANERAALPVLFGSGSLTHEH